MCFFYGKRQFLKWGQSDWIADPKPKPSASVTKLSLFTKYTHEKDSHGMIKGITIKAYNRKYYSKKLHFNWRKKESLSFLCDNIQVIKWILYTFFTVHTLDNGREL